MMESIQLTWREIKIIRLAVKKLTAQEIAFHLSLSLDTVELYQKNIIRKLNAKSKKGAVAKAIKMKLI